MLARLRQLLQQENGQDLVEYGLLAAFVVLASIVVWQLIANMVGVSYRGYDTNIQDLWEAPDPPAPPPVG